MRTTIIRVVAAAFAMLFAYGVARAEGPCIKLDRFKEVAAQRGDHVVQMTASQLKLLNDDYNDAEPKSDDVFDSGWIIEPPGGRAVVLLFFKGECLEAQPQVITREHFERIIGRDA